MLTEHIPLPDFPHTLHFDQFHGQRNVFARSTASGTQWGRTTVLYRAASSSEAHKAMHEFKTRLAVVKALTC